MTARCDSDTRRCVLDVAPVLSTLVAAFVLVVIILASIDVCAIDGHGLLIALCMVACVIAGFGAYVLLFIAVLHACKYCCDVRNETENDGAARDSAKKAPMEVGGGDRAYSAF